MGHGGVRWLTTGIILSVWIFLEVQEEQRRCRKQNPTFLIGRDCKNVMNDTNPIVILLFSMFGN